MDGMVNHSVSVRGFVAETGRVCVIFKALGN